MKNDIVVKEYLKDKTALVVTESSTDRTAWKKVFVELGVGINKFYSATSLKEALEILDDKSPEILFSSYQMNGEVIDSLIEAHIVKFPDRTGHFCFVVSEKNSLAVTAAAAESDIDGLLIKPYNQLDLTDLIEKTLFKAINLSKDLVLFNSAMGDIRSGQYEKAQDGAEKYILAKPESPNGYYLHGLIKSAQGELDEAIKIWNIGHGKERKHHKLLCSLFDGYIENKQFSESYRIAEILTDEFPINPKRIPNFIRASLTTENFQNLITFCQMIVDVDDDLTAVRKPIAAALAISGKHLLLDPNQKNRDLIILAAKKSIELSDSQSKIFETCLENLIELGKFELVKEYIDPIATDDQSTELLTIDLRVSEGTDGPESAFIKAQNLLKINKFSPNIYRVLLRAGKKIGKTSSQLEDIAFDGAKKFPELKDEFFAVIK
ncbi:MAG: tetratricopeptide (TPR) repeat protein [Bacteriovoracaceae bacterium]|jgi:tetratricopeptide (TPR) repeat protein